ncbi:MAG: hypothetical protein ACQEWV_22775 [Bacillota bacterium]
MSAVAEMERSLIKEKQRNGVAIAKSKGKYSGRVKKYRKRSHSSFYRCNRSNNRLSKRQLIT